MTRTKTETIKYQVYDCPFCGKETKLYSNTTEETPCHDCDRRLEALMEYRSHEHLIGATITDILVEYRDFSYRLSKLHITNNKGKYTIEAEDYGLYMMEE